MKLTMLGTGNALVTKCYNTCFLLEDQNQLFMVDGGGGNMILRQIQKAGYHWMDIRHIFVTHKHLDHLIGILWMVRMIWNPLTYKKDSVDAESFICIFDHTAMRPSAPQSRNRHCGPEPLLSGSEFPAPNM